MHIRRLSLLVSLVLSCITAAPAVAAFTPYVRVDYGGNELRMSDVNDSIEAMEQNLVAQGAVVSFRGVGTAYGPSVSAGVWLLPEFRLGAVYSYQRAVLTNVFSDEAAEYYLADDNTFRMLEIGLEAAVRMKQLGGLIVGGDLCHGHGELTEGLVNYSVHGQYFAHGSAKRDRLTGGVFVGFEQTNEAGIAGFIRAGYRFRDMGEMPSDFSDSDGVHESIPTVPVDFSGFCLRVGVGYDFLRH
jgi:hypothetical protein